MAKTFHPKIEKNFSLRNTLKHIFMLFPEFTKNQNPTKSDQIRPNPTKSDQVRPSPTKSDGIRRSDSVGVAPGGGTLLNTNGSLPKKFLVFARKYFQTGDYLMDINTNGSLPQKLVFARKYFSNRGPSDGYHSQVFPQVISVFLSESRRFVCMRKPWHVKNHWHDIHIPLRREIWLTRVTTNLREWKAWLSELITSMANVLCRKLNSCACNVVQRRMVRSLWKFQTQFMTFNKLLVELQYFSQRTEEMGLVKLTSADHQQKNKGEI